MSRSETPRDERDRGVAAEARVHEISPTEMRPTERERNVLALMARGMTDRDIATELRIAPATARKHREHLMRKLDVRKSSQVVALLGGAITAGEDIGAVADEDIPCPLSARERDVLALLARGLGDKEVARTLGISDHTARKHRANMLKRAGVRNSCALLHRAMRGGWLRTGQTS